MIEQHLYNHPAMKNKPKSTTNKQSNDQGDFLHNKHLQKLQALAHSFFHCRQVQLLNSFEITIVNG